MKPRVRTLVGAVVLLGVCAASEPAAAAEPRYALAGGCHALRSEASGETVVRVEDGYRAATGAPTAFRLRATALGRYLLFDPSEDFVAAAPLGRVQAAGTASEHADWEVREAGATTFTLVDQGDRRALAVSSGGDLVTVEPGSRGAAERFAFVPASGCEQFPEAELNATGEASRGTAAHAEVRGLVDAHTHLMAFEFLGGQAHCGRPWHPWGIAHALVDCPDHQPNGEAAVLENTLADGQPLGQHSPHGWPTFAGWPRWNSLTHEGVYYRWLERAWMGGLRVFVNLLVDNSTLCEVYPLKRNSCNEMESVRLQIRRTHELQDYVDAQHGGPGKGWFRIVDDPFEARRVANEGKLAVVLGIEVSELFDCGIFNEVPECDRAQIDRQLEEFHRLGVRQMELVNKFDNALGGVAGDAGNLGTVINTGNFYETGRFWDMRTCTDESHDHEQATPPDGARDVLVANGLREFLPGGLMPLYPDPPHCNQRGLSPLGEHLVRRMIERRMIVDPDHLSVIARRQLLTLLEREGYSGVISSHSWSTPDSLPRIHRLGGVVTPMAGSTTEFAQAWRETREHRDPRFYWGIGWGADMNGFAHQGEPRKGPHPVTYPFKSFDGSVTLDKQRSGQRVYDINVDGVAHYGLYPDFIEDLRVLAGEEIIEDLARGPEAYLQMWERAVGVEE
nr:Coagulation factor 5/8 type domain-containing protein [Actinomycetota bacterium]